MIQAFRLERGVREQQGIFGIPTIYLIDDVCPELGEALVRGYVARIQQDDILATHLYNFKVAARSRKPHAEIRVIVPTESILGRSGQEFSVVMVARNHVHPLGAGIAQVRCLTEDIIVRT